MLSELEKLEANLGGVADLKRQPDAVFVIDLRKEQIAVREARRLGLPIIGARRHELRSRRGRLRDPRQRRRDPLLQPDHPRDRRGRSRPGSSRCDAEEFERPAERPAAEAEPRRRGRAEEPRRRRPRKTRGRRGAGRDEPMRAGGGCSRARRLRQPHRRAAPRRPQPRASRGGGEPVTRPRSPASLVKELRDETGAGMMDCKRALAGDGRRRRRGRSGSCASAGMAEAGKRAGRETTEGIVALPRRRRPQERSSPSAARPSRSPRTTSSSPSPQKVLDIVDRGRARGRRASSRTSASSSSARSARTSPSAAPRASRGR